MTAKQHNPSLTAYLAAVRMAVQAGHPGVLAPGPFTLILRELNAYHAAMLTRDERDQK